MKDDGSAMEGQASNPEQDATNLAEALNSLGGYLPTSEAEVEALDRQVGELAGRLRTINSPGDGKGVLTGGPDRGGAVATRLFESLISTDIRLKVANEVTNQAVAREDYSNFNLALRLLGSVDSDLDQDELLRGSITGSLDALFALPQDQLNVDGLIDEWWTAGEKEVTEFRYRAAGAIEADRAFLGRILNFASGIDGKEFTEMTVRASMILGSEAGSRKDAGYPIFKDAPTEEQITDSKHYADYLEQRQLLIMILPEVFGSRALPSLANGKVEAEALSPSSVQILRSTLFSFVKEGANPRLVELVRVAFDANILNSRQDSAAADAVPLSPEVRRAIFASHIVNRFQDQPPEKLYSNYDLSTVERKALLGDLDSGVIHYN